MRSNLPFENNFRDFWINFWKERKRFDQNWSSRKFSSGYVLSDSFYQKFKPRVSNTRPTRGSNAAHECLKSILSYISFSISTGCPLYMREMGTDTMCSHITNSHIKRPMMTINKRIGSRKMANSQSHIENPFSKN